MKPSVQFVMVFLSVLTLLLQAVINDNAELLFLHRNGVGRCLLRVQ